jgi:pimeloyl-ACP methyl ester carboxylesterase
MPTRTRLLACALAMAAAEPVREMMHVERWPDSGQYLHASIHGADDSLPLLFFVNGGFGVPNVAMEPYFRPFSEHFLFVTFNLRGVLSVNGTAAANASYEHVEDAAWMLHRVRRRFGKDKAIIAGLSNGADIILRVAYENPDAISAVIAASAIYNATAQLPVWERDQRDRVPWIWVKVGEWIGVDNFFGLVYGLYLQGFYGGMSYKCLMENRWNCVPTDMIMPWDLYLAPGMYSITHFLWLIPQITASMRSFADIDTKLLAEREYQMPVHILAGQHDLFSTMDIAVPFFESIVAPTKRFHLFEKSTHFIPTEEPERFLQTALAVQAEVESCETK